MMIPAKLNCLTGWTLEYRGYLMSEWHGDSSATHECVDAMAEAIPGTAANTNGGLFHIEAMCGDRCPNYDSEKELTCVVCTH